MDDDLNEMLATLERKYDGPGRGRKLCTECNNYVGARLQTCHCGHTFDGSSPKEKSEEYYDVATLMFASRMGFNKGRICYTPAGDFKTKLTELTQNGVTLFCDDVVDEYALRERALLHKDAIKYIGRTFLCLTGEDLDFFKMCVDNWFNSLSEELV